MRRAQLELEAKKWEAAHGVRPQRIILSPVVGMKVLRWLPAAQFDTTDKLCGMKLYVREQGQPVIFEHDTTLPAAELLASALGISDDSAPMDVLRRIAIILHDSGAHPRLRSALGVYIANRSPSTEPVTTRERVVQL